MHMERSKQTGWTRGHSEANLRQVRTIASTNLSSQIKPNLCSVDTNATQSHEVDQHAIAIIERPNQFVNSHEIFSKEVERGASRSTAEMGIF